MKRAHLLLLALAFEGGMAAAGCVLGWLLGFPPWLHIHWRPHDLLTGLAATVPMLLAFIVLFYWPVGPLRSLKDLSVRLIAPLFRTCTVLDLAVISLLAGVGEELLFRGFLMPALTY
jgi:membrane protease YdiL (CAAX protease family)